MIIPDTMTGGALLLWYLLTGASLVFLVYDLETNTPAQWVMKLAWILIVLYTGPLGLFTYMLSCREPLPGTHDAFIAPHWKQSVGSLMHCVAGDATGIILGAIVTYHLSLPNGIDLMIEYAAAFVVGLLIFQALFMKSMAGGNYLEAVKKTFFAETVSMNFVMVGMIPVMAILRMKIPGGADPKGLMFWGISSIATIAGAIAAYPVNSWLVGSGLKHGMMSAVSGKTSMQGMPGMPGQEHHEPPQVPLMKKLGVFLISAGFLLAAVWATSLVVELKLR